MKDRVLFTFLGGIALGTFIALAIHIRLPAGITAAVSVIVIGYLAVMWRLDFPADTGVKPKLDHYLITLIQGEKRSERNIIAHSAVQATSIGLDMMPDIEAPFCIICKPVKVKELATNKTMKWLLLNRYLERRRRAARIAQENVSHPYFHRTSWLACKLAFDREFRAVMRASSFS
jgi:hypothetical protein